MTALSSLRSSPVRTMPLVENGGLVLPFDAIQQPGDGQRLPAGPGRFAGTRPIFADDPDRPWLRRVTTHPLVWVQDDGLTLTVPIGFVFDGATIPRVAWSLIGHPFSFQFVRAACLHDFECDYRLGTDSDDTHARFRQALAFDGVGRVRRSLMWAAVRVGGPDW